MNSPSQISDKPKSTQVLVIMGVAGSGKTTVGNKLAEELGWQFADADSFHPPTNVDKMRSGLPLHDADRWPWLEALKQLLQEWLRTGQHGILACSALKRSYREMLAIDEQIRFVYLKADYSLLQSRLSTRQGHFMKSTMLESQIEALEEPAHALYIDASQPIETIVRTIRQAISV